MRSLLITNIGELTTNSPLGTLSEAAIVVTDTVQWVGAARDAPAADGVLDAEGAAVLPGFVDSHSHLVFAGDRAAEFAARMSGEPYTGGGIRTTVAATRAASDEQLRGNVARLRREALRQGTTTIEIKSGYGLTTADETRSLRIAAEFTEEVTFLGAHVKPTSTPSSSPSPSQVPGTCRQNPQGCAAGGRRPASKFRGVATVVDEYVALVTGEMLAACAPYAKWIDVFCERGAFDVDESRAVLTAGIAAGLRPRIHANQLTSSLQQGQGGGVQLAVELDCASADHCTHLSDADVDALASGNTVATLLPGAEFSTRAPYPDARRLLDAGVTVALATDCNPGSSYTSSMPFCIALAVREMGMTPDEAIWAATAGGAAALRRPDLGHLDLGARADLIVLDAPSRLHLAYRPGVPLVRTTLHMGVPQ